MKYIKTFLIPWASAALLAAVSVATGETVHIAHCLQQCPPTRDADGEIVVRHLYAAAIDPASGLAEWVAYRVMPGAIGVASLLPRFWQADGLLRSDLPDALRENEGPRVIQPDLSDAQDREYRVNEVLVNAEDRGRLAPMSSFAGTPYWEELNNLSNMAPLPPALRLGSWSRLEIALNELAAREGELHVVAGPLPGDSPAYFKVIAGAGGLTAFAFPRDLPRHADFCAQVTTLTSIEARIGHVLFPAGAPVTSDTLLAGLGCPQQGLSD